MGLSEASEWSIRDLTSVFSFGILILTVLKKTPEKHVKSNVLLALSTAFGSRRNDKVLQ